MATDFVIGAWTELALVLVSILLRLYFRFTQVGLMGMTWDGYLVVLARILYALETAAAHIIVALFAAIGNNNFTPEQCAKLIPGSEVWKQAVNGSKTQIFGWFVYSTPMWKLKSCWTIYYPIRIKMAWFLNGTTYIAAVCMAVFKCWPLHRQWQNFPDPGNTCYPGASKLNVTFITVLNISTDLYLMAIPLPITYRAHLDTKRKASLMILFSGGWIVIIFGILRCVTLVTKSGRSHRALESGQWSVRKSFLAFLVSNAPMVFPLLKRQSFAAMGIVPTDRKDSKGSFPLNHLSNSKERKSTVERSHTRSRKRSCVLHPLSIPNDIAWGSDDAIVTLDKDTDEIVEEDKNGIVALGMISEARVGSFASERRSRTGEKRSSILSPDEILIAREWMTMEGQAVPGLDRREVQVETAGLDGMQGSVVKLEDVRRDEAVA